MKLAARLPADALARRLNRLQGEIEEAVLAAANEALAQELAGAGDGEAPHARRARLRAAASQAIARALSTLYARAR